MSFVVGQPHQHSFILEIMAQTRRNVALEKKNIRNLASCERKV